MKNIARGASMMALSIVAFASITIASAVTPSPNNTVVTAGSTASIIDTYSNAWTITAGKQAAVNGVPFTKTANIIELAYVNNVIWEKNNAGWYSLGYAPAVLSGPVKTSPLPTLTPSANDAVVMGTNGAIIDAALNSWTISSGGQMVVNGTIITVTGNVTELAYVNGVVWQLNSQGNWYSVVTVQGATTTFTSGTTTSPLPIVPKPSPNDTTILAPSTAAIIDSALNAWTITSGGQMAVNGTTITVTSGVTELAYASNVVWQLNAQGNWYSVVAVQGATTTFSNGTTTSPLPVAAGSAVPYGMAYFVGGGGPADGPGGSVYDSTWDGLTTLMGRAPTLTGGSLSYYGDGLEADWEESATAIISNGQNPITKDIRTNAASGTIPMISWPFGTDSGGNGGNFFANIAAGNDDAIIQNVIGQFVTAGYKKLILRPAWELNGNWYGWQLSASNYTQFLAAWEHFYTVAHTYAAANGIALTIVFAPNQGPVENSPSLPLTSWVPPAAYIDTYSIDFYSGYAPNFVDTTGTLYVPTAQIALAKANGKSIAGSEIGGLASAWVQSYVALLSTAGVPINYWAFWDSDLAQEIPDGVGSWSLSGDTDCTTGTSASGAGGTSACGVTSSGTATPGTVAGYWVTGFGANIGSISGNQ